MSRDYNITLRNQRTYSYKSKYSSTQGSGVEYVTSGTASLYAPVQTRMRPRKEDLLYSPTRRNFDKVVVRYPHCRMRFDSGSVIYTGEGPVDDSFFVNQSLYDAYTSHEGELATDALYDALTKLKEGSFNAGVALAEAGSLADDLTERVRDVQRLARAVKRGDLRRAYDLFRRSGKFKHQAGDELARQMLGAKKKYFSREGAMMVPSGWTYYNFALVPTAQDISGAIEEFRDRNLDKSRWGACARGYSRRVERSVLKSHASTLQSGIVNIHRFRQESVRTLVIARPRDKFLTRLSDLGATNPPEAVWNGLPFSWLVDYFVGVGDYLALLDLGLVYDIWPTWTHSYRDLRKATYSANNDLPTWRTDITIPGRAEKKMINRSVTTGSYGPIGSLLPRVKPKVNAKRFANMTSVLAGLMHGMR